MRMAAAWPASWSATTTTSSSASCQPNRYQSQQGDDRNAKAIAPVQRRRGPARVPGVLVALPLDPRGTPEHLDRDDDPILECAHRLLFGEGERDAFRPRLDLHLGQAIGSECRWMRQLVTGDALDPHCSRGFVALKLAHRDARNLLTADPDAAQIQFLIPGDRLASQLRRRRPPVEDGAFRLDEPPDSFPRRITHHVPLSPHPFAPLHPSATT